MKGIYLGALLWEEDVHPLLQLMNDGEMSPEGAFECMKEISKRRLRCI